MLLDHGPDAVVGDLVIAMAQDVADVRDAAPGDFGMRRLQLGRDVALRL